MENAETRFMLSGVETILPDHLCALANELLPRHDRGDDSLVKALIIRI